MPKYADRNIPSYINSSSFHGPRTYSFLKLFYVAAEISFLNQSGGHVIRKGNLRERRYWKKRL